MYLFRWLLILNFVISFCTQSLAQNTILINGKVMDGLSGQPLPYANIYFNNTTIGTTSDSSGSFEIRNVPIEFSELIVSSVGYKILKTDLTLKRGRNLTLEMRMAPDSTLLKEVVVEAKGNKLWRNQFAQFKKIFLGTSANAAFVEIINPQVLKFKTGDTANDFVATSRGPLILENRALGYRVFVSLENFRYNFINYTMLVKNRFEPLKARNGREENRWRYNRMLTYKGSMQHLFRSIKKGNYAIEGFRIFKGDNGLVAKIKGTPYSLLPKLSDAMLEDIIADSSRGDFKIFPKGIYQVNYVKRMLSKGKRVFEDYPFPVSWLEVKDSVLSVNSFGALKHPADLWRFGYFDSFRMADMLPLNFDPFTEESSLILSRHLETADIRGVVKDENDLPLPGVLIFINNGLQQARSDAWGQFVLPGLTAGRYPIAFAYSNMITELKNIDVPAGKDQYVSIHLKEKTEIGHRDSNPDNSLVVYKSLFERKLLQQESAMAAQYKIINPYVLSFKDDKSTIDVSASAPLIVEHSLLGYRWTYFIDKATLIKRKGGYDLKMSGAVSMESLAEEDTPQGHRFAMRQFDEYHGSWNHFATSLAEGRLEDEGFETYINVRPSIHPVKFKTAANTLLHTLPADSVFTVAKGNMYVKVPTGLEVHSAHKSPWVRYYRGYSKQVMRITSDTSAIKISRHGITAFSNNIKTSGIKNEFLKRVPADYKVPFTDHINESVLLYLREENLKQIRNLLEKVYVHTDRPYYYPGDTLWMKSYMKYQNPLFQDSLSKVLYIELISPQKKIVASRTLRIENGQSWGEILLSPNLPPGDYFLRAYTNWMCNFEELFIKPVPVLASGQSVVTKNTDTRPVETPGGVTIAAKLEQQFYKIHAPVKMRLDVLEDQKPMAASMSISITALDASPDIENIPTILSLNDPFKADGSNIIRLNRQIEKGITFYGKIKDARREKKYTVSSILPTINLQNSLTTDAGGRFRLTLDFDDTTRMIIKPKREDGTYAGNVEITGKDSVKISFSPVSLKYTIANRAMYSQYDYQPAEKTLLLSEVEIRARRISNIAYSSPTERRMIAPAQKIAEGDELSPVRTASHLPSILTTLIASRWDENGFYSTRGIGGGINFQFYLNGSPIPYSEIKTLNTQRISRIEFYVDPIYAISIYEEPMYSFTPSPKFDTYLIKGYDIPSTFSSYNLKHRYSENRLTMYWNPNIKTNEHGSADISFYTGGLPGKYKIVIEGITTEGTVFRTIELMEVKE